MLWTHTFGQIRTTDRIWFVWPNSFLPFRSWSPEKKKHFFNFKPKGCHLPMLAQSHQNLGFWNHCQHPTRTTVLSSSTVLKKRLGQRRAQPLSDPMENRTYSSTMRSHPSGWLSLRFEVCLFFCFCLFERKNGRATYKFIQNWMNKATKTVPS